MRSGARGRGGSHAGVPTYGRRTEHGGPMGVGIVGLVDAEADVPVEARGWRSEPIYV